MVHKNNQPCWRHQFPLMPNHVSIGVWNSRLGRQKSLGEERKQKSHPTYFGAINGEASSLITILRINL